MNQRKGSALTGSSLIRSVLRGVILRTLNSGPKANKVVIITPIKNPLIMADGEIVILTS